MKTPENRTPTDGSIPAYGIGNGLFYLWHLQCIGLVDQETEEPTEVWEAFLKEDKNVRVAIIDNGCTDIEHPNLPQCRIQDEMEFVGFLEGAVYGNAASRWGETQIFDEADICLAGLVAAHGEISGKLKKTLLNLAEGPIGPHCYGDLQNPTKRFSAHGTSTAGIIAAQPEAGSIEEEKKNKRKFPTKINYCGINPLAKIIPINTVYSADYAPVIMALLYAVAKGADVIVMPRVVHDIGVGLSKKKLRKSKDPRATRKLLQGGLRAEKGLFEEVLRLVSAAVPVVIAAGNDGGKDAQYPASLRFDRVGQESRKECYKLENLFIAGAATASASLASYSSGGDKQGIILMPSDDAQITDTRYQRPDLQSWRSRNIATDIFERQDETDPFGHTPYGVLTIDIPGQYGYASQGRENTDYEDQFSDVPFGSAIGKVKDKSERTYESAYRSLYAVFGGTSASSAILAGVLSLCQNLHKIGNSKKARLTGTEMRELMEAAGTTDFISAFEAIQKTESDKSPLRTISIVGLEKAIGKQSKS